MGADEVRGQIMDILNMNRACLQALRDGKTSPEAIMAASGLSATEVQVSLQNLRLTENAVCVDGVWSITAKGMKHKMAKEPIKSYLVALTEGELFDVRVWVVRDNKTILDIMFDAEGSPLGYLLPTPAATVGWRLNTSGCELSTKVAWGSDLTQVHNAIVSLESGEFLASDMFFWECKQKVRKSGFQSGVGAAVVASLQAIVNRIKSDPSILDDLQAGLLEKEGLQIKGGKLVEGLPIADEEGEPESADTMVVF